MTPSPKRFDDALWMSTLVDEIRVGSTLRRFAEGSVLERNHEE